MAELLGPDLRVRPAAELGDDEPALVADDRRVDVLVAPLDLGHGGAVDAALVGERRPADVRLVVGWATLAISATLRDSAVRSARSPPPAGHQDVRVLSARLARMLTMFALPQRSP